tara:strand:- start:414 stop:1208 length:795 start_codon:yes stop_codon:yes gene_type:complete
MFDHFLDITIIIFFGFATFYPILLSLVPMRSIDQGFYRFNLGLSIIVGALAVLPVMILKIDYLYGNILAMIWFLLLFSFTAFNWNSKKIENIYINIISLIGICSLGLITSQLLSEPYLISTLFSITIGSIITALVFFSMILGHWYLNVIQLPIKFLFNSTLALTVCLLIRSIWDIGYLSMNFHIDEYGLKYSLWSFLVKFEGFLMLVGFLIGIIFPLLINFLAFKSIRLQATQSATGLLYVSIVSILFGDLIFKFYLFQYGFTL